MMQFQAVFGNRGAGRPHLNFNLRHEMKISLQRPTTGSKPWYGNFSLGILVDNHPRFTNVILALVFVELVVSYQAQSSKPTL